MTWQVAIGVDPSTRSTGWCVLGRRRKSQPFEPIQFGQCAATDAHEEIRRVLPKDVVVELLTVETLYQGRAGHGRKTPPVTHYRMGFAAGRIVGAMLATYAANVDVWMPAPNQWRDMLSIKRGKRDDVNRRVHAFAQSFTGQDVKGPRGGLQLDAANAIGLACAGVVRRSRRHNVD